MNSLLDIRTHNENLLSIKDTTTSLELTSRKLDRLFEQFISHAESVYFIGLRPSYDSKEVNQLLNTYSCSILEQGSNNIDPFRKIIPSCLLAPRNGFNTIWELYEYPFLFFVGKGNSEQTAIESLRNMQTLENTLPIINNTIVVYRSFEQDVIWIQKSNDIAFPDW